MEWGGVETVQVSAWWQWLFYPFHFGALGVTLFFVISGFCIHWSYLQWTQKHPNSQFWPQYFVRRFYRIYPPYLAGIVMVVAIGILFIRPRNLPAIHDVVLHLFMVHNLDQDSFFKLNGSFWSLAVEWQLYLVYPLFLMLVIRLGFPLIVLMSGALYLLPVTWNAISGSPLPFWVSQLPFFYWFTWGLGAFVAERHFHGLDFQLRSRSILWLLALFALIAAHFEAVRWMLGPAFSVIFAVWVGVALRTEARSKSIIWRGLKWVGVISYSMYLLHQPLLARFSLLLEQHVFGKDLLALATVGALFCCIVIAGISYISWRFIELPSQDAGRLFVKKLNFEGLKHP
jgi:peptidoglycan/LPS O-acetylase OafA/YrhL